MSSAGKMQIKAKQQKYIFIIIAVFLSFCLLSASIVRAVDVSSSLNPVGSGARATGMGGAFIGVADDATAASWNPAGLIQLERPEISVVYSYFKRNQRYRSSSHPEIESENNMDSNSINYASFAYPFRPFKQNMIISVNYQRLYEMNKDVSFRYLDDIEDIYVDHNYLQEGYLYALSPAMAMRVTPVLYIGAALNLWDNYLGRNGWEIEYTQITLSDEYSDVVAKEVNSFKGTNANFGFLWKINGSVTLGGVYKTPFNGDLEREISIYQIGSSSPFKEYTRYLTMKMPASYGLGLSYRYSDTWTMTFDVYRTEWSRFLLNDESGKEYNPFDYSPISEGRLKDTIQVRLGSEYLFIKGKNVIPMRFGLFYDPEPQKESLDDYYGFSLGTGFVSRRIALDIAYQYRTADDVTGDISAIEGTSVDIKQHLVMTSAIYYF
jgi:long-subunit fatty acid transport protein